MSVPSLHPRSRIMYVLAAVAVIALGLASRKAPGLFPLAWGKYPGDALWALMVLFCLGVMMPAATTWRLASFAAAISFAVELSQIYQAPWINGIRGTTLGHLVLGSTFNWGDLPAYLVGIAIGALLDLRLHSVHPFSRG